MYSEILRHAWALTKSNKRLWFFGFFVSLLGNSGAYEAIISTYDNVVSSALDVSAMKDFLSRMSPSQISFWQNIERLFQQDRGGLIAFIFISILFISFILLLIWLVITSQINLISSIANKKTLTQLRFKEILTEGRGKIVPVLGINLLAKIVTGSIFFLTGLIMLWFQNHLVLNNRLFGFLGLVLLCVNIMVSMFLYFFTLYTNTAFIIAHQSFLEALRKGWHIFRVHWWVSVEMTFILFLISIFAFFVLFIVAALILLPFAALMLLFALYEQTTPLIFVLCFAFVLLLILSMLFIAILATFQTAVWVLLFQEFEKKNHLTTLFQFSKQKFLNAISSSSYVNHSQQ